MNTVHFWESTLKYIQKEISPPQFDRWFKEVSFVKQEARTLTLRVPSRFHQDWLNTHYKNHIDKAIEFHFGESLQLEFEVLLEAENVQASQSNLELKESIRPQLRVVEGGPLETIQTPSESKPIEFPDCFNPQIPHFPSPFFELDFNRLAFQYCGLFCEGSNSHLNPLIIQGGVGMGKTHLLGMLGKALKEKYPQLTVRYTHAEKFTQEIFKSWNDKQGPNYQSFYREQVDILLFDDLQQLSGRKATQEALLHIYNEILSRGGRVVFTSGQSLQKLTDFIEPLRSRLFSGVSSEIKQPSYEDRVTLLSLLAQQNQIPVEESVLRVLADQGYRDIRELLGTLVRLHLQASLEKKPLNGNFLAKEGVSLEAPQAAIQLPEIIALVEQSFGISKQELISKSRKGLIVWARQVAMYLGRRFTLLSLDQIGKAFERDHATVLYAYDKVVETLQRQPSKKYEVEFLIQKLQKRLPRESSDLLV